MMNLDIILEQTKLEQERASQAVEYVASIPRESLRDYLRAIEDKKNDLRILKTWTKDQWQEYEFLCYLTLEILAQLNNTRGNNEKN